MSSEDLEALPDLPNRLRRQADNVEGDGWLSAARLMRDAADHLEQPAAISPCPKCGAADVARCGGEKLCADCWNVANAAWQKRRAIRQDPAQFEMGKLLRVLLTQHWMHECEIVPAYMPPFPRPDTRPRCVVRYTYDDGRQDFLRHSLGPLQGFGWDSYGDDLHSPELALIAISQAPAPPRVHAVITTYGT